MSAGVLSAVVACVVATALLVFAEARALSRSRIASKLCASIAFVAIGFQTQPVSSLGARFVLAALVLSAIGDVFLLSAREIAFILGLGAFLLAHVAYAAAFVVRGISPFAAEGAAFPAVIVGGIVLAWLLPHVPRALRGAVMAYALVITVMVVLATGTALATGNMRVLVAALAFYVSDLSVARDRFVAPGFSNRAWGLPLYYGAQILFALFMR